MQSRRIIEFAFRLTVKLPHTFTFGDLLVGSLKQAAYLTCQKLLYYGEILVWAGRPEMSFF